LYKSTVYISDNRSRYIGSDVVSISDGLYNYTVSYINTAYISLLNVDMYFFVGGGGNV